MSEGAGDGEGAGRLEPRRLFSLACREALRDGVVEPVENELLRKLQKVLGLSKERAIEIARAARTEVRDDRERTAQGGDGGGATEDRAPSGADATWILGEVDAWLAEGVISGLSARTLRERYGAGPTPRVPEPRAPDAPASPPREEPASSAGGSRDDDGWKVVVDEAGASEEEPEIVVVSTRDDSTRADPPPAPPVAEESLTIQSFLAMMGALFVGLGAVVLLWAHWEDIGTGTKTAVVLLGVAAAYAIAYEGCWVGERSPTTGDGLVFLGGLLFAGGLPVMAYLHGADLEPATITLLWVIGVAPMVFVTRSHALYTLMLLGIWGWLVQSPLPGARAVAVEWTLVYGLLLQALGDLGAAGDRGTSATSSLRGLGGLLSATLTFAFTYAAAAEDLRRAIDAHVSSEGAWQLGIAVLLHAAVVLAAVLELRGAEDTPARERAGFLLRAAVLAGLAWFAFPLGKYAVSLCFNAVWIWGCMTSIRRGMYEGSGTRVNLGVLGVGVWVLCRYFEYLFDMRNFGLSLVLGGTILMLVAWQMERWRQGLLRDLEGAGAREPAAGAGEEAGDA